MINEAVKPDARRTLAFALAAVAMAGAFVLATAFAEATAVKLTQGGAGAADTDVKSLHVQGNVWMLVSAASNAVVQVGNDGVLVIDTMTDALADKMVAEIRKIAGNKPIRYVINTHIHGDHTGGNEKVAAAGQSIIAGNFAGQVGQEAANLASVIAHENVLNRMSAPVGKESSRPFKAWPTDTFFVEDKDLYFNGEGIQLIHIPAAHTDGDVMVYFRKSDVIAAGDLFITTLFPPVDMAAGGNYKGILAALNRIIDITIPRDKQEGGTYVIPGHGRLTDEADVVDYRDMATVIRDRFLDAIKRGQTLEQVKAAKIVRDYEGRYGANAGPWTTDQFVEAVYKSLTAAPPASTAKTPPKAPAPAPGRGGRK
jgi:glyoxylase-like metal-dependent hydrolase (beta-lactamase superfamily II)